VESVGVIAPRLQQGDQRPARRRTTAGRDRSRAWAAGLALLVGCSGGALADTPPGTAPETPPPTGSFLSSVKQAFNQNFDHDVVRGHFDLGLPPDTHRYYCLVDAKTGKREANGVGGQPFVRPDRMTGIKAGAVSFYSCASAEQQGRLVTDGYVLSDVARGSAAAASAPTDGPATTGAAREPAAMPAAAATTAPAARAAQQMPGAAAAATAAASASGTPAAQAAPAAAAQPPNGGAVAAAVRTEVTAAYARFIAGQNAHDAAAVAALLLDSRDFVWAQMRGNSIWGHTEAMAAFQDAWKGSYRLDPQYEQLRITAVAPGVAVLITPLLLTQGGLAGKPAATPVRWGGVFVNTPSGWLIASIFITPFERWKAGD
jgi:ketosteroid isomerase-like protein